MKNSVVRAYLNDRQTARAITRRCDRTRGSSVSVKIDKNRSFFCAQSQVRAGSIGLDRLGLAEEA